MDKCRKSLPKRVVIPGGSGHLGTLLACSLSRAGHQVVILSRRPMPAPWRVVAWDGQTLGPWAAEMDGSDAVINLAGRSVNCRYSAANRRNILQSRVESTAAVGGAIAIASKPPDVWLQASTATIYAHRFDAANDERTGILGGAEPDLPSAWRFSLEVASAWERELDEARTPHTRKVKLRAAMVMSPERGGTFDLLLRLVRFGLGGPAGDGQQFVSWIHDQDFIRAVQWLLDDERLDGPINLAAPNPVTNVAFMHSLRQAWGMPIGVPAARWMLEVGAVLLRTETELILKSRRVVPGRLLDAGFKFDFPHWPEAAADLCGRWRGVTSERTGTCGTP